MLPNGRGGLYRGCISIAGDRITGIAPEPAEPEGPAPRLDVTPHVALPGFVDLQVNGAFGWDVTSDPPAIWRIGSELASHGVTAFAPTVVTSPADHRRAAYEAMRARPSGYSGAEPLGLHIEGPALAPRYAGAHRTEDLVSPTDDLAGELAEEADVIALVTVAPDGDGATELIVRLTEAGIPVSLGHSGATAAQAMTALAAGASALTHLFNGMAPVHHREVGIAGAGLLDDRAQVSLIVDGSHLSDDAVLLAWRLATPRRIHLVTDSMAGMGTRPGTYRLGAADIRCDESARDGKGSLAGSLRSMPDAAGRLRRVVGANWDEIALVTSTNAAALLDDRDRGRLEPGRRADIAVVDADLRPVATIIGGALAYRRVERAGSIRSRSQVTVGVDIGGSSFKAAVFDGSTLGPVLRGATGMDRPARLILAELRAVIDELASSGNHDVVGVGVACPGVVDGTRGVVVRATNLGWRNVDVIAELGDGLAPPVAVEHDVYLGALAEWETGAGVGAESMLYVSVGTGVAARLFTSTGTYRGSLELAGEMGFLPVGDSNRPLESVGSARAMSAAYRHRTGREATLEEIVELLEEDVDAAQVWSTGTDALARGIAAAICLQDPGLVVIGGGVSQAGAVLLDSLAERLQTLLSTLRDPPPIALAAHGADSGVVGAASYSARRVTPTTSTLNQDRYGVD